MLVVLRLVERLLTADGEAPVVEFSQMATSLFGKIAVWNQTRKFKCVGRDGSDAKGKTDKRNVVDLCDQQLAFELGLVSWFVPVFRERADEFTGLIGEGLRTLLGVFCCNSRVLSPAVMAQASSLITSMSRLMPPASCDEVACSLISPHPPTPTPTSPSQTVVDRAPQTTAAGAAAANATLPKCVARMLSAVPDKCEPGLKFLYCLAAAGPGRNLGSELQMTGSQTVAKKQGCVAVEKGMCFQNSGDYDDRLRACVSSIFLMLAGEVDPDDHTAWFMAVSKFVREHSPLTPFPSTKLGCDLPVGADHGGVAGADTNGGGGRDVGGDACSWPVVPGGGFVALQVMGGRISSIQSLAEGTCVETPDGLQCVVAHSAEHEQHMWLAGPDGSIRQCEKRKVLLHSGYSGRLGPRTLGLLLPHVLALKNAPQSMLFAVNMGDCARTNAVGPTLPDKRSAASGQDAAAMAEARWIELRVLKALVEHACAYDGYGLSGIGGADNALGQFEFATKGAKEVAEELDEKGILTPIIQLALRAHEQTRVSFTVSAMEECLSLLEAYGRRARKFSTLADDPQEQLPPAPVCPTAGHSMVAMVGSYRSYECNGCGRGGDGRLRM